MKKLFAVPLIIGLIAVPSIVSAHGSDANTPSTAKVHQAVKHKSTPTPVVATTTTAPTDTTTPTTTTDTTVPVPGQTDPVPTSTEGDVSSATISWADAIAQAQAVFPGKTLVKAELENEHGTVVYEFKFSDGTCMKIDAVTGKVLESKMCDKKTHRDNRDNEHSKRDFGHEQGEHHRNRGSSSNTSGSTTTTTTTDDNSATNG